MKRRDHPEGERGPPLDVSGRQMNETGLIVERWGKDLSMKTPRRLGGSGATGLPLRIGTPTFSPGREGESPVRAETSPVQL